MFSNLKHIQRIKKGKRISISIPWQKIKKNLWQKKLTWTVIWYTYKINFTCSCNKNSTILSQYNSESESNQSQSNRNQVRGFFQRSLLDFSGIFNSSAAEFFVSLDRISHFSGISSHAHCQSRSKLDSSHYLSLIRCNLDAIYSKHKYTKVTTRVKKRINSEIKRMNACIYSLGIERGENLILHRLNSEYTVMRCIHTHIITTV